MSRHRTYGFSFSLSRALGISAAKGRIARATGIPTTRSGRQRKFGRMATQGWPLLIIAVISIGLVASPTTQQPQQTSTTLPMKPMPAPDIPPAKETPKPMLTPSGQTRATRKPSGRRAAEYAPGTTVRLQSQYRVCGAGLLKYGQVVEGVLLPNGQEGTLIRMRTDRDQFESWRVGIIQINRNMYQVDADDFVAVEPQPVPKKVQAGSKLTQAQRDAQIQKNLAKNKAH